MTRSDYTGQRFGRLVAMKYLETVKGHAVWLMKCDCGGEAFVRAGNLKNGHTQSCGCLHSEVTKELRQVHGFYYLPAYKSYMSMMARCTRPKTKQYDQYAGRGIKVCQRWRGRNGLRNFISDMGARPDGMTLDRVNNDGDYSPENCRWATRKQQQRNRRGSLYLTYRGKRMPLAEAAERSGISYATIRLRFRRGTLPAGFSS